MALGKVCIKKSNKLFIPTLVAKKTYCGNNKQFVCEKKENFYSIEEN